MAKPKQAPTPTNNASLAQQHTERIRAQQQAMSQAFSQAAQIGRSMPQAPSQAQDLSAGRTGQLPSPTTVGQPGTDQQWSRMVGTPANNQQPTQQRETELEME